MRVCEKSVRESGTTGRSSVVEMLSSDIDQDIRTLSEVLELSCGEADSISYSLRANFLIALSTLYLQKGDKLAAVECNRQALALDDLILQLQTEGHFRQLIDLRSLVGFFLIDHGEPQDQRDGLTAVESAYILAKAQAPDLCQWINDEVVARSK